LNQYVEIVGLWLCFVTSFQLKTQKIEDPNLILIAWQFWFIWLSFPNIKKHLKNILEEFKKKE
jgi:hypothetical protein